MPVQLMRSGFVLCTSSFFFPIFDREENANLKKMRKQQEAIVADMTDKRDEMLKWCEEERRTTIAWCEAQKQAATKERRAAAKFARDTRLKAETNAMPIRYRYFPLITSPWVPSI